MTTFKRILILCIVSGGVFGLSILFIFVGAFSKTAILPPFTYFASQNIGLIPEKSAKQKIIKIISDYENKQMLFASPKEVVKFTPPEIGVEFDINEIILALPKPRKTSSLAQFIYALRPYRIKPAYTIIKGRLFKSIQDKILKTKIARNARLIYDPAKKTVNIQDEIKGYDVLKNNLLAKLDEQILDLDTKPILLEFEEKHPSVTKEDLIAGKDKLLASLPKKFYLNADEKKWTLRFPEDIKFIEFRKNLLSADKITASFSEYDIEAILNEYKIAETVETKPQSMKIYKDKDGNVIFEGKDIESVSIDRDKTLALMAYAFANKLNVLQIPLITTPGVIEISDDLKKLGVRELIGTGYTTYFGSPKNRIHNIGVGVKKFSGVLIPQGHAFSFNEHLGIVDASTGYKPELVIKSDGTKPEFGGGLCQVSTTMYRTILFTGLPVVERFPHTYAVTYYSQALGHGIDATIYPGVKDLRFLNDTPGYILIQGFTEGLSATFRFFGTSDGRNVEMEGPYIENRKGPPPDVVIYTTELDIGAKKLEEKPHGGFDSTWYRYVTKNGKTEKETIFSRYRAMPAKYLVGGEAPVTEEDKEIEAARQFE